MRRFLPLAILVAALALPAGVALAAPTADLRIEPAQPIAGQVTTLSASGSECDVAPCSYRWYQPWEFDRADGIWDTSASFVYRHVDLPSESHQVTLRVQNADGETSSTSLSFKVVAAAPPPEPTPDPTTTPPPVPTPPPLRTAACRTPAPAATPTSRTRASTRSCPVRPSAAM